MQETEKIWMNGELVDWADARIHVGAHGLHYGTGVFEGIRCYATERGPAVFRLVDHLDRLDASARMLYMELPYTTEELRSACFETLAVNGLEASLPTADRVLRLRRARRPQRGEPGGRRDHLLPLGRLPRRDEPAGRRPRDDLVLAAGRPEHDPARGEGDRCLPELDARHARGAPRAATTRRSCSPRTATSRTARARRSSSSRTGPCYTPDLSSSILPGITRDTIIQIAQDLGYTGRRRSR